MGEKRSLKIRVKVNEKDVSVPFETTLLQLKEQFKPNSTEGDRLLLTGFLERRKYNRKSTRYSGAEIFLDNSS